MARSSSNWPTVRAALLAVVIGVQLLLAAPLPHAISDGELRTPTAREELRRWCERLGALGYDIEPVELGERVQAVAGSIAAVHRSLKRPFRTLSEVTGTGQGWALFANPQLQPLRFEVRVRRAGLPFERRYAQLDPVHDWWRARLRYRRVRGCWDTVTRIRPVQRRFGRWLATRIMRSEPDVEAVQTRLIRTATPLPGRPRRRIEEPRQVLTWRRADVLGDAP